MGRRYRSAFTATILACLAAWPWSAAANEGEEVDTDGDGISDRIERRTGTDHLRRDTDADGVPDGVEDSNLDGRIDRDEGETDPSLPGLFPGSHPHIPEPLVFDLVRGLGAKRGELEANTLALVNLRDGRVHWAPEIEWAFADGYAIEVEVPMVDRHVEAFKLALQGTLPNGNWSNFAHGWQTFAEIALDDRATDVVLLYMFGNRFHRSWSYLTMIGAKTTASEQSLSGWTALLNPSLFYDAREWLTVGLESNLQMDQDGLWLVRLFPQIHIQIGRRARIQLSAGVDIDAGGVEPLFGTRLIIE